MKFRIHSFLSFPRTALKGEWGGQATIIFSYIATSTFKVSLHRVNIFWGRSAAQVNVPARVIGMVSLWGECVPGVCEVLGLSPQAQHCKNQEC